MALNNNQLQYIEVFCEAFLYGVFSALMVVVLYILTSNRKVSRSLKVVFCISIFMFAMATAHMALILIQALQIALSFNNIVARMAITMVMFILGDSILIWRVWVVWAHNFWVIIVPVIMLIISAAFGFYSCATVTPVDLFSLYAAPSSILTMALSIICTGLITGRLWYLQHQISQVMGTKTTESHYSTGNPYKGIMLLLCESGAIYAAVQAISVILDEINNVGIHVMDDINIPLVGLLPTLIIVLVHFEAVPGSHLNKQYTETIRSRFVAAAGPQSSVTTSVTRNHGHSLNQTMIPLHISKAASEDTTADNDWKPHGASSSSIMQFAEDVEHVA